MFQVDNEFFVPHGYLSDEEEDKDEDEIFNPEKEKVGKIFETWEGGVEYQVLRLILKITKNECKKLFFR